MKPDEALAVVEAAARALVDRAARSKTPHLVVEVATFEKAKKNALDQTRVFPVEQSVMDRLMNTGGYDPCLGWCDLCESLAIASNLHDCALSLLANPGRGGFWERVLFAYEHGFWPCGWEGTFPDMRLLGYRFVR